MDFNFSEEDETFRSEFRSWLDKHQIPILNVAGNRASQTPEIADLVRAVLELVLLDRSSGS